jgi:class 3 adenylate cyclase
MGPSVNLAARLMCAAAKSDKDVYVESGIERATSVSPQARLCVFNACEPIKAKGFSEMVKVRDLGVPLCRDAFTPSMRLVAMREGAGWSFCRV